MSVFLLLSHSQSLLYILPLLCSLDPYPVPLFPLSVLVVLRSTLPVHMLLSPRPLEDMAGHPGILLPEFHDGVRFSGIGSFTNESLPTVASCHFHSFSPTVIFYHLPVFHPPPQLLVSACLSGILPDVGRLLANWKTPGDKESRPRTQTNTTTHLKTCWLECVFIMINLYIRDHSVMSLGTMALTETFLVACSGFVCFFNKTDRICCRLM